MIHRNKIFTNFATSNKDYPVHSSSGLGRRPLTAETRVRTPDALQKPAIHLQAFFFLWPLICFYSHYEVHRQYPDVAAPAPPLLYAGMLRQDIHGLLHASASGRQLS